jgi:UDP:flavonoid glycosyltransferase YjiC (YdhE family)
MKIVIATFGSLGDIHPKIALGLELRERGHDVVFSVMEFYREKVALLGFDFSPLRPNVDPDDRQLAVEMMDAAKGTEKIITELIVPNLDAMFGDLMTAVEGAGALITGEIIYPAASVVEKTGIPWISTSLAPISFFSAHDPCVYPIHQWYRHLHFLPVAFHRSLFRLMTRDVARKWLAPYRDFRNRLGLDPEHDPIFYGKNSDLLHLALFSKALAVPQPDWHRPTLQAGFCFYDGQRDSGLMPEGLERFLEAGEPPIVFTLGSAAAFDAGDFFVESARAAKILGRRAVLLYGAFNEPPRTDETGDWRIGTGNQIASRIAAFEYAPYSKVFPRAACVVHQGGVGTTGQALRAGVPQLVMPYSHDQPDNAERCRRRGVAETISRDRYSAERAALKLRAILADPSYSEKAEEAAKVVARENGVAAAADAIDAVLRK